MFSNQAIHSDKEYRYWRIQEIPTVSSIAEIAFWDKEGIRLYGTVDSVQLECLDGNLLTCLAHCKSPLVVDFGKPVSLSRIVCLPRSDGNGIYPGNEYELFYYTQDGWGSLGIQRAGDYYLDYRDVPSHALYWLHNRTHGLEERVFTVEDGKVRFW